MKGSTLKSKRFEIISQKSTAPFQLIPTFDGSSKHSILFQTKDHWEYRFPIENSEAETLRKAGALAYLKIQSADPGQGKDSILRSIQGCFLDTSLFLNWESFKSHEVKLLSAFCEGFFLASYRYSLHSSSFFGHFNHYPKPKERPSFLLQLKLPSKCSWQKELLKALSDISATVDAVDLTRDWSNLPPNLGTPSFYAKACQKFAKQTGLSCTVLNTQQIEAQKMGLLLGVSKGSSEEPKLVILKYSPSSKKNGPTLGLVGKGITFDSGGISLKPSLRMEEMKHDMTGAATVAGVLMAAATMKLPYSVIGLLALSENMPDGKAIQPGCVLLSRSGKSVEVINTDAEGRLILGDALDYIQDFQVDGILDLATLTGAVSVALGKHYCGIMGNTPAFTHAIQNKGKECGEKIWELPLDDEYLDDLKSEWADLKNSANDGLGGTIRGAIFLKQFIKNATPWAHLDIANTAYNVSHFPYFPKKGATGAHVRTCLEVIKDLENIIGPKPTTQKRTRK